MDIFEQADLSKHKEYLTALQARVLACHDAGVRARENKSPDVLNAAYALCIDTMNGIDANYVSGLWHNYEVLSELCEHERKVRKTRYIAEVRDKSSDVHKTLSDAEDAAHIETHSCRIYALEVKQLARWAKTLTDRLMTIQIQVSHFRTNQNF